MQKWSACCKNILWVHSLHSRLWHNYMSTVYCVRTKENKMSVVKETRCAELLLCQLECEVQTSWKKAFPASEHYRKDVELWKWSPLSAYKTQGLLNPHVLQTEKYTFNNICFLDWANKCQLNEFTHFAFRCQERRKDMSRMYCVRTKESNISVVKGTRMQSS